MSKQALVLVTGASGYLGTHVVRALLQAGHKVRGTVRSLQDDKKVKHLRQMGSPGAENHLELVEADLNHPDSWLEAVKGCKFVHHVASPSPSPLSDSKTADESDELIRPAVDGTLAVLEACRAAGGVSRVVLTGSFAAIGLKSANTKPYDENDWAVTKDANYYGQSKILAEQAAWKYIDDLSDGDKFELAVVNPSLIAGPTLHGSPSSSMEPVCRLLTHDIPMVPRFCLPIVDVRDVAQAHLRCMDLPQAAGQRHILFGANIWMPELASVLNKEFRPQGYRVPTYTMPEILLFLVGCFDKDIRETKAIASRAFKIDNSRMTDVLGIKPRLPEQTYIDMAYSMIEADFYGFKPKNIFQHAYQLIRKKGI